MLLVLLPAGCAAPPPQASVHRAFVPPASREHCSWFGDDEAGVIYFGESPFWRRFRASKSDPAATASVPGPAVVGRFDLARERFLEALEVAPGGVASGVWDVLAQPDGRVWFTTFFERAGWVDVESRRVIRLGKESVGLAELAPGPDGLVMASRYGAGGAVVMLDDAGDVVEIHPLSPAEGRFAAAKSVAFDPARQEFWVNTDLIALDGTVAGKDARILARDGQELWRIVEPEVQFVTFGADGVGYLAEVQGAQLALRILPPGEARRPPQGGQRILLDEAFPADVDFAQEVRVASGGAVVVTRWSGIVHLVLPGDLVRTYELPRVAPDGLYYTGVLQRDRLCVTLCAGVQVVCRDVDVEVEIEPEAKPEEPSSRGVPRRRRRR